MTKASIKTQQNKPQVTKEDEFEKQLRDLVVARLSVIPKNLQVAVGSNSYTIEELVDNVKEDSKIGKQVIAMQIKYLKDLASGEIYKEFDAQQ